MPPVATEPRAFLLPDAPGLRLVLAEAGLACCTLEVEAAVASGLLVPVAPEADPADASPGSRPERIVLLVSGTVTHALAPAVVALHAALQRGGATVQVMAVGACASTGGPYWDAPTVLPGVDHVLPVASYVPGCPPSPRALIAALLELEHEPTP